MTTLDDINQAAPIEGSHTIKTSGHYTGWPITIQIIHIDGGPTLRIQQRPNHKPDSPPQTVFIEARRLHPPILDQLRDAAENRRLVKNPPLPNSPFTIQPTALGLKVRYKRAEYFFVKGAHTFAATKAQWQSRGFKVKKTAKPTKELSIWHIRQYYEFTLYHIDDTQPISGKKARWRRDDFHQVIDLLIAQQTNTQKLQIHPKLPL